MKIGKILWGLAFVALAVLLILDALGVLAPVTNLFGEVSFWQIAGGFLLFCGAVAMIVEGEAWLSFVLLGFIFMIFERNIAQACGIEDGDIINNWLVFGCSVLLGAGFGMLFSGFRRKRKKSKKDSDGNGFRVCVNTNEMGASEIYIDCAEFGSECMERRVENKVGGLEVRFENVEEYRGGATLYVTNKVGGMEIYVPKEWCLVHDIDVVCGALEVDEEGEQALPDAPVLIIKGSVKIGAIEIERV
ncbi:MAG: hypothetical protein E7649_01350 [Ruminococcaceae bacterium]|nr:hypothetical protein [Oscillospiraceae bacterium]